MILSEKEWNEMQRKSAANVDRAQRQIQELLNKAVALADTLYLGSGGEELLIHMLETQLRQKYKQAEEARKKRREERRKKGAKRG